MVYQLIGNLPTAAMTLRIWKLSAVWKLLPKGSGIQDGRGPQELSQLTPADGKNFSLQRDNEKVK